MSWTERLTHPLIDSLREMFPGKWEMIPAGNGYHLVTQGAVILAKYPTQEEGRAVLSYIEETEKEEKKRAEAARQLQEKIGS